MSGFESFYNNFQIKEDTFWAGDAGVCCGMVLWYGDVELWCCGVWYNCMI